jgi:ABC-type branched-subunit amino acid transport system substrate-binding protein
MLSTLFSTAGAGWLARAAGEARRWTRAAAVTAGLGLLSACQVAPTAPQVAGPTGPALDPAEPVRVALLVPLGTGDPGRDAIGRSLVNAAQLAQNDLQGVNIAMRVYETAGTTGGGAAAARRAVEEGAQVIVGPLFSTATAGAQPVAAQAGLPVFSFSNNPDVAGGNVYLLGVTFDSTADRVVSYAASRGLRNIGVVYPQGLEGETARRAVAAAAQRHGSAVVAQQGYELSVQGIERSAGAMADRLRGAGANAVVLADLPTGGLGYVADGLRARGFGADSAQFLGIHRWDVSAEILGQSSLQGSWFAAPDPAILGGFESRYRAAYGQAPHEVAGLAYDGIAAVGALVRDAQARRSPNPFAAANIVNPGGFAGVYGPFRLLPNGLNQRNLAIREVRGGSAPVVDRAPRAFVGLVN